MTKQRYVAPMSAARREAAYRRQRQGGKLTPRPWRRMVKKVDHFAAKGIYDMTFTERLVAAGGEPL